MDVIGVDMYLIDFLGFLIDPLMDLIGLCMRRFGGGNGGQFVRYCKNIVQVGYLTIRILELEVKWLDITL